MLDGPRFLALGTGRCGSRYLASVLRDGARIPVLHEEHFPWDLRPACCGDVRIWDHPDVVGEVSAAAVISAHHWPDAKVWHHTRHPRYFVTSNVLWGFWGFQIPLLQEYTTNTGDPVLDSYRFWFEWNQRIEQLGETHVYRRFRSEDISPELIDDLVDSVGGGNSLLGKRVEWTEMQRPADVPDHAVIHEQVRPMAERYGYTL